MVARITPIKTDERSEAVANLHAAIQLIGLNVPADELAAQHAGPATIALVQEFQKRASLRPQPGMLIDQATAAAMNALLREHGVATTDVQNSFWVRGIVRTAGGQSTRGLTISAYDQDLRKRQLLGRAAVRADGEYTIVYGPSSFGNAEIGGPDLVLEVGGAAGGVIFTSPVNFNVPGTFNYDIQLPAGTGEAEYDATLRLIQPLLDGQDAPLDTLDENDDHQDVTFLAGETGLVRERLTEFVLAWRLGGNGLLPEFWYALLRTATIPHPLPPGEGWKSLADAAQATEAAAFATSPDAVESGLERAVALDILSKREGGSIPAWMKAFRARATDPLAGNQSRAGIQRVASLAGIPDEHVASVADAYAQGGSAAQTVERLRKAGGFTAAQLQSLQTHLTLHAMTFGNDQLVTVLGVDGADPHAVRKVAQMGLPEWQDAIRRAEAKPPVFVAGKDAAEQRENFARLLTLQFHRACPTAAFAAGLRTELRGGGETKMPMGAQIAQFFDANPDFDLATHAVDRYLADHANAETATLLRQHDLAPQLKAVQRVYKVAPEYGATSALLKDGIHSAQQIARIGKQAFVRRYADGKGFTARSAELAYDRAVSTNAATNALLGELHATETAHGIMALDSGSNAVEDFPNLTNLFGRGDACACDQCRSVFSAAAYLADLLMFLEQRKAADGVTSAKSILFRRRADIGEIELTCPNTNTTLPYIDLACEVLEDQVAPWVLFVLPAAVAPLLVAGPVDPALQAALAGAVTPITLTAAARLSGPDVLGSWILRDTDKDSPHTWRIKAQTGGFAVSILRQTRGTPEELSANPEWVNAPAYQVLAGQTYPMSLPFDLPFEEVHAYLAQISVSRASIMEAFRGPAAPNNPADLDIAADSIGVAPGERDIIFVANPAQQFQFWGEADNAAAIAAYSHVDTFLDRTGLSYLDLQTLLTLGFVNPAKQIAIVHLDTSCDLSQKRLQPLDTNALDRIHRFLRLWRKLGWAMADVDLAIRTRQVGNGTLDNAFLGRLYPFLLVRERLGNPTVEQCCALFDELNTAARFVGLSTPPKPSLYEHQFLNKQVLGTLDPAFAVDLVTAADAAPGPAPAISPQHRAPVLAGIRLGDAELDILLGLQRPVGDPGFAARHEYIDGKLSLGNLSFLYRHALVLRGLGLKAADWSRLLYLLQQDPFRDPATLLSVLRLQDRVKAAKYNPDELAYVLGTDLTAKAAMPEKTAAGLLAAARSAQQAAAAPFNGPAPAGVDVQIGAIAAMLQMLGWDAVSITALQPLFKPSVRAGDVPATFGFPAAIAASIPVSFDAETRAIGFAGLMSVAQRTTLLTDPTLAAVAGLPGYQAAINQIFALPRPPLKFYAPEFRTKLPELDPAVQFSAGLPPALAVKVSYDAERGELVFFGVMTAVERVALKALSADPAYAAAVDDLFNQPAGAVSADRLWIADADDLASALAKLTAFAKAGAARNAAWQSIAQSLAVTPAVAQALLEVKLFGMPKHALLQDLTDSAFVASSAPPTAASFPSLFEAAWWLHRVALVLRKASAGYVELVWALHTAPATGALDFTSLPLAFDPLAPAVLPPTPLLDLARFLELARAYRQPALSVLDVLDRVIGDATYTNQLFAADVTLLLGWNQADLETLTGPLALDIAYPAAYRTAAAWDRLWACFDLLMRLNGSAAAARRLAGPAVNDAAAQLLRQFLRGKYEPDQWLDISKSVQDALRQRKRDSLTAYLLTLPMPADAPSHKWQNTNDLYAYYLIDVEMCSCMATSRIVQATNSVQLFVQRAFMGLEPAMRVSVDDDDAWSQWTWMENYRVWEANRRVFVYPENYAEPELKLDRSEIFKALQDELLQGDVARDQVETAFLHYLEKLDQIAQLEIAGTYYQESNHTLHIFGRTPGSEPHTYFYRQFIDSHRWTPWSKVECDIKGDTLVPLVANERLHLVWPEFRQRPDDPGGVNVPSQGDNNVSLAKPRKIMDVYLAVTEYRSGKWMPKKVTQDPVTTGSGSTDDFDPSPFVILPLDFTWLPDGPFLLEVLDLSKSYYNGRMFELAGCKGYPEPYPYHVNLQPIITRFDRDQIRYLKNAESSNGDPLVPHTSVALTQEILALTPGFFRISYPQYMSSFDKLWFFLVGSRLAGTGWGATGPAAERRAFYVTLGSFYDWFYADKLRTFFVQNEVVGPNGARYFYQDFILFFEELLVLLAVGNIQAFLDLIAWFIRSGFQFELLFDNFYHPLVCGITKALYAGGIDKMMSRETQFLDKQFDFNATYAPQPVVDPQYPVEVVDFTPSGSYAQYNWELFYFGPLFVAGRLTANQHFAEAKRWYEFIFDPTGGHDKDPVTHAPAPAPQKYWITKPFYLRQAADYEAERIDTLMNMLAASVGSGPPSQAVKDLQDHIADWRKNPFDPHLVAQFRTVAYQKLAVTKYIDNLIAWGDQQFRLFTMESVNMATQLYVLAAEILGPRPRVVPPPAEPTPETFNEIEAKLDAFSNAMVELENFIPAPPSTPVGGPPTPAVPHMLYFCIPTNDQLAGYWDLVDSRLYNLRHCLDLDGVPRQLALFAPPIDPAAIINALAGGADLASAIAGLDSPLPNYRFLPTLQKANEFTNDLKSLASALLSALEKKDAEALSRLRQQHEIAMLNAARAVKQAQIDEATDGLQGLQKTREMVTIRRDYYSSRPFLNAGESGALAISATSLVVHAAGTVSDILGGVVAIIPDFQLGASGFGGSPHVSAKMGGQNFSKAAELAARALYQTSTILDKTASMASTLAGHQRRMDDWQHQANLASKELEQVDRQIAAAQIRVDNAKRELDNHDLQVANSKEIDAFFHSKYTKQELYEWMSAQISQTFFQTYQLAFDMARRAERCFQFELGIETSSYIQFGYWDSLKSGLLVGERLQLGLHQLEVAYLEANRREFECTKHVSLAQVNPIALLQLKDRGLCIVDVPEELFDLDYPGQFFRRVKSVSLSLPCIAGPHTTINCTLRLLRNMIRVDPAAGAQYEHNNDAGVFTDDARFRESHVRVNAIAASTGQNDNGMFELNFRDERYLPFEGAGAMSTWQIELVADRDLRQFDYDSLSDVVLHIRYTAREDLGRLRQPAIDHLKDVLKNGGNRMRLRRMFDLQREFATEWYAFLHPAPGGQKSLIIPLTRDHFPFLDADEHVQAETVSLAVQTRSGGELKAQLSPPLAEADLLTVPAVAADSFATVIKRGIATALDPAIPWALHLRPTALGFDDLDGNDIEECFLVVEYTLQP